MAQLRHAVGLRNLGAQAHVRRQDARPPRSALPSFKQYREADGQHYFKLVDAAGRLLAQSTGFDSPQEAGRAVAQLKRDGLAGLEESLRLAEGVSQADLAAALAALTEAD